MAGVTAANPTLVADSGDRLCELREDEQRREHRDQWLVREIITSGSRVDMRDAGQIAER
jgi:hypothetical protein